MLNEIDQQQETKKQQKQHLILLTIFQEKVEDLDGFWGRRQKLALKTIKNRHFKCHLPKISG